MTSEREPAERMANLCEKSEGESCVRKRHRKSDHLANKAHFRIDWRQLSYYHHSDSYSARFLTKLKKTFLCVNKQSAGNNPQNDRISIQSNSTSFSCDYSTGNSFVPSENFKSSEPKRILNSLDGSFRSGQLSAILGPSGAGKSTFLSALFGEKQERAYGQTKVTWFADSKQAKAMTRRRLRIVFLPQHDHLLHHLTVYEALLFTSKIKNKFVCSEKEQAEDRRSSESNFHRQNVRRVAKMLKLNDCLDTRCGRLSGGQYKRVSIAQELLSNPDVMILDEPTSGLDAMTCLSTITTLKSIVTKHPMSIILTIHQPDVDVFNTFDHLYVIAQGGLAIYEGPPSELEPTMARMNLFMPSESYNPARFVVENAFLVPEREHSVGLAKPTMASKSMSTSEDMTPCTTSSDEDDEDDDQHYDNGDRRSSYLKRSILSLTEAISGREMSVGPKRDKKPLLNLGIRTLDGKLITSEQLAKNNSKLEEEEYLNERWNLLRGLNQLQRAKYYENNTEKSLSVSVNSKTDDYSGPSSSGHSSIVTPSNAAASNRCSSESGNSSKSDYSSAAGWMEKRSSDKQEGRASTGSSRSASRNCSKAVSLAELASGPELGLTNRNRSLQNVREPEEAVELNSRGAESSSSSSGVPEEQFVLELGQLKEEEEEDVEPAPSCALFASSKKSNFRRQFDKRLSSKHNSSKYKDYPIWGHALILTHRTWLSIIRDPIFFGIQATMHTTIPILLSLIFGSSQEEGCPRIGSFDLVEFAYSDSDNLIQGTVKSIRQSIGNIGVVFFEMFVLCFCINCITALVFPLDMHVLLKEYRNGWYSLRSYFIGRTLADLPVPIVLHSLGMSILYYMTGQPHSIWRYLAIIALVILSSLVAQSVGLTVGALLMKSSQSAVLAAAGIVAPIFALSGFIVRIHTLPLIAQAAAQLSYLYHMLNGFIIVRYGFGRCQCKEEDFDSNAAHQIPNNLHTMASIWIGTYSNEFADSNAVLREAGRLNRTNVDPNIDVVDKMMTAFKMANSYGHKIESCSDVLPYAMLDFNLRDQDIYICYVALFLMLLASRLITFSTIYYKIRSFT